MDGANWWASQGCLGNEDPVAIENNANMRMFDLSMAMLCFKSVGSQKVASCASWNARSSGPFATIDCNKKRG